jgi:CheY-like chemotaxis protein
METIIIAEDDDYNFLYIEEILSDFGYLITRTLDGQETVDMCKNNPFVKLILMDIQMPGMDGHAAAKIIRKLKPNIPIIAQTAYALAHEIAKYSDVFDDYIIKPINEAEFIERIKKYLNM